MSNFILKTNQFEHILIERATGSWIVDVNGKKYLDCESGMWCCNLGHNPPEIIEVIKTQSSKIIHRNKGFLNPVTIKAAEKLLDFIPGNYDKITFLNSGSEAVEFAINFAKKITKRKNVLSLKDSYLGAFGIARDISFTSQEKMEFKLDYPISEGNDSDNLEEFIEEANSVINNQADDIACFVLEPIMIGGGVLKPCSNFVEHICNKMKEIRALVIVDEVTTGFGRAGKKFGYELFDITPDILALGKALGNGYPVSAIVTRSDLEEKLSPSELYYAQSHQLDPLGTSIALKVVELYESKEIIEKSKTTIEKLHSFLKSLSYPFIQEVRSFGLIYAIVFRVFNNLSTIDLVLKIKDDLLEAGVMIGYSTGKEQIRFLPPLNITNEEIEFLQRKIIQVFDSVLKL
jgi:acetylornithine aminotransferase